MEEQRQKLHYIEIELATTKQQVVDLKVELIKAKEAAQVAQVVMDATGQKFNDLGVPETEARLTDKLDGVCRDYCLKVWTEALNVVGAPVDSGWSKAENVYYPKDLREAPKTASSLGTDATPAMTTPEQPPTTWVSLPPPEATKGPSKVSDPSHGVEVAKGKEASQGKARPKDKGKGKEAAPKIKESEPVKPQAVAQEKKATLGKVANPNVSQPVNKEDPPPAKA